MRKYLILLTAIAAFGLVGCSKSDNNSPKNVQGQNMAMGTQDHTVANQAQDLSKVNPNQAMKTLTPPADAKPALPQIPEFGAKPAPAAQPAPVPAPAANGATQTPPQTMGQIAPQAPAPQHAAPMNGPAAQANPPIEPSKLVQATEPAAAAPAPAKPEANAMPQHQQMVPNGEAMQKQAADHMQPMHEAAEKVENMHNDMMKKADTMHQNMMQQMPAQPVAPAPVHHDSGAFSSVSAPAVSGSTSN